MGSQTLCAYFSLFCTCVCVSAGQCSFNDELSLIQERAHALSPQHKWPDISQIVDDVRQAVDAGNNVAHKASDTTIQNALDGAVQATTAAIQTVVEAVRADLQNILREADTFDDHMQIAIDDFLQEVQTNPQLMSFERAALRTLNASDASFLPLMSALNVSVDTVQNILKDSGYVNMSQDVGGALTQAMVPINKIHPTVQQLQQILEGFDEKVNKSSGSMSSEIDTDLKVINKVLHDLVVEVNTTFNYNTLRGYNMLLNDLIETIEGVLPEEHLYPAVESLLSLVKIVNDVTDHVGRPLQSMEAKFNEVIFQVREAVPANAHGVAGFSFLALTISVCANLISL